MREVPKNNNTTDSEDTEDKKADENAFKERQNRKIKKIDKKIKKINKVLGKLKSVGESARGVAKTIEKSLKSFVLDNSNLFEALNLRYFGPIDGHDVNHLV